MASAMRFRQSETKVLQLSSVVDNYSLKPNKIRRKIQKNITAYIDEMSKIS